MRSQFIIALIIVLVGAGVYWYQATAYICPAPLTYRLGELDASFGVSKEEARQYITTAEKIWEEEVGRQLFVFDEEADFYINFVFDERQEKADSEADKRKELDQKQVENSQLLKTVETLQTEYSSLSESYEKQVQQYETRLSEHNGEVNKYNDRGGAPPDVYQSLEDVRVVLAAEAEGLTATATKLNKLAAQINKLSEEGNKLVNKYNQDVNTYNTDFGFVREFTQGDYQGNHINVYKFSSEAEVVAVLAHEFGHALGLDHVEGAASLMYYLMEEENQSGILSAADKVAYYDVCGFAETYDQKIRRIIRDYFII